MKIELLYFDGCPSHEPTLALLNELIAELGITTPVVQIDVETEQQAQALRFPGSPTIRIDDRDIEPAVQSSGQFGRRCRVYFGDGEPGGVPSRELVRLALQGQTDTYSAPTPAEPTRAQCSCCCDTSAPAKKRVELLTAEWCPQCPPMRSLWRSLRDSVDFDFVEINIESEPGIALAQKHGIRSVPAVVIDGALSFIGEVPDQAKAAAALGVGRDHESRS